MLCEDSNACLEALHSLMFYYIAFKPPSTAHVIDGTLYNLLIVISMATRKKQEVVKQEETLQNKQEASSEKKTATKKEKSEVKVEKDGKKAKTPTLAEEYASLKEKHPDAVLLFRKEDFYLTVNEDAKKTSEILGITLTRPKDASQGTQLAMFPYHALDSYLPKLIRAGARVAIVDDISTVREQAVSASVKEEVNKLKGKDEPVVKEKTENDKGQKEHREPQMITVNGEKVSHGHVFQSNRNPETWYFTAKIDGKQLRPMIMSAEDLEAYRKKESSIEQLMKTYYPTKLEKKVSPEEYKADNKLSDGRVIDKMNVYKENNEQSPDFGKYKLYAVVGDQKMSTVMTFRDLNAYFDRVTTPAQLVEKNFGEKLHLASAYEKYKLPEGVQVKDIRIAKDKQSGQWNISVDLGEKGRTSKMPLAFDDGYSYFTAKTATREQLAAKYLNTEINGLASSQKKEQSVGMKR